MEHLVSINYRNRSQQVKQQSIFLNRTVGAGTVSMPSIVLATNTGGAGSSSTSAGGIGSWRVDSPLFLVGLYLATSIIAPSIGNFGVWVVIGTGDSNLSLASSSILTGHCAYQEAASARRIDQAGAFMFPAGLSIPVETGQFISFYCLDTVQNAIYMATCQLFYLPKF